MELFLSILWISLTLTANFIPLKSNLSWYNLPTFLIHLGCKSIAKHLLKHSLSLIFGILIRHFLGWSNSFGKLIYISLVFISQSYFKVPKTIRRNATHYFIIKIPNKRQLQQIASNHSSDIMFRKFMEFYKDYIKEPFSFLVNDTTFSSDNLLRFRKNLL